MTEADYAWAAGFLDGDGSFSLRVYRDKNRKMIQPFVQSSQQCSSPIDRLYKIADGGYVNSNEKSSSGKQIWRISILGRDRLLIFLEGICPHLIVKQKQCQILLKVLHKQKPRGGNYYCESDWDWFFEQKKQIEDLNKIT